MSTPYSLHWQFDNTYARLPSVLYSRHSPTPVLYPQLILFNTSLAQALGLHVDACSSQALAQLFAGNVLPPGADPIAQAYAGHQYAYFTMLGDGRAILLGEHITPKQERVDIQLKGSGTTPYSRQGDGRAAIGPMLREYIISEAMQALGIPTTRSLAVVETGEMVYRHTPERGAILTRVASSHIRVGTFEYLAAQRNTEALKSLTEYCIQRHYPESAAADNPSLDFLKRVVQKQIDLIVAWMRVGFIHGVMNTDNMAISGETIDYGPCAFIDDYDPATVFSSIDRSGRYAYGNQPKIMQWNLARFAECLLPLLHNEEGESIRIATEVIVSIEKQYEYAWLTMMRKKLGMSGESAQDRDLVTSLLSVMHQQGLDYTNTFVALTDRACDAPAFQNLDFKNWVEQWQKRCQQASEKDQQQAQSLMRTHNPRVIPRNHLVEEALNAMRNDENIKPCDELLAVLEKPYEAHSEYKHYHQPPEDHEKVQATFCGT